MPTLLPCPPPRIDPRQATELHAHRLRSADACDLIDMFERMSPRSRHMRFFAPMPVVQPASIRRLCDVDQDVHRAWIVRQGSAEGPVIAEVRGVREREHPHRAEVALAVRDDWSGQGLGAALIDWIGADLASGGVTTLTCEVHPENARSRRMFSRAGFAFRFVDGALVGEGPAVRLAPAPPIQRFRLTRLGT
jgi:RimJ/RimL family protein N-acetyltransferase